MSTMDDMLRPLADARVTRTLARLHREAGSQDLALVARFATQLLRMARGQPLPWERLESALADKYLAVDPKNGVLLYMLARSLCARTVVEHGTSYGVSTLYLAAAVRDNVRALGGTGRVIGTERVAAKAARARAHAREAGLEELVEVREGDAPGSLEDVEGPIDLLFNDGFPPSMLPVLRLVAPRMRPGAIVVSGNATLFPADHVEYLAWLRDPANGFRSASFPLSMGGELSVRTVAGSAAPPS